MYPAVVCRYLCRRNQSCTEQSNMAAWKATSEKKDLVAHTRDSEVHGKGACSMKKNKRTCRTTLSALRARC